ncbi:MAG: helix-turn-helix transcriptional regulator [Ignavibacteria bacterium]|nr:helix-turn-helix transcriptional regulator [Ignavibacteria bacterium]
MKKRYSVAESHFLKQIGLNVIKYRQRIDLSQEDLALKCDVDRSYMGRIERGENNITIFTLKKIADSLKIEISELLKMNGK